MAHTYSLPQDVSFYTRYGQGTAPAEQPSHLLRNSAVAAVVACAFSTFAIAHGIGNLPPIDARGPGGEAAALAAATPPSRTPLETLAPEIAAQAALQPVHVNATVTAPDLSAALYAEPDASDSLTYDSQTDDPDTALPADSQADEADAVVDVPDPEAATDSEPADAL